jgi:AcrR family transcriptional regulator
MSGVKTSEPTKLTRRGRAKATQWRIVKAAYTLFCERGYTGTTMADIAAAAGVAVQTVYFTFHTKATLLSRAYDFAVMGDEEPLPPEQQPWYVAMVQEPDASTALRQFVTGVGEITRRVTPLELVARVAADGDPDTARVMAMHEGWRAEGYRAVIELLRAKAELRPGLTPERATDLLLLYVGMDVYHALVEGRRWSHEEWSDWAGAALAEQVFGPA